MKKISVIIEYSPPSLYTYIHENMVHDNNNTASAPEPAPAPCPYIGMVNIAGQDVPVVNPWVMALAERSLQENDMNAFNEVMPAIILIGKAPEYNERCIAIMERALRLFPLP